MKANGVLLHEFSMRGHDFRAYWMESQGRWFVQNRKAEFDFPGHEDDGLGRVKAQCKKILRKQYEYLLENASRVVIRINGIEGYLDTFPFRIRKRWAQAAALVPLS